jgi:adhesin transport system outer membrane protein
MFFLRSILVSVILIQSSIAMPLDKVIKETLLSNDEIKALVQNNKAYRLYVDEQKASYYPKLDLQAYVERKKETTKKTDGISSVQERTDGSFAELNLEQVLYEGGAIDARVSESSHKYRATKFANYNKSETIVLNTIKSYLDYVKYDELIKLSEINLKIQNDYLITAIENERISGSALERMQVESKISYANSKLLKQRQFKSSSASKLEKFIGKSINSSVCRPVINKKNIPSTINEVLAKALLDNYEVKEQIENIKVQNALIEQEKAKFKPRVVAKLKHQIDKGLDVSDVDKKETSGRIELNYNLFNGLKDKSTLKREKHFLSEAKSVLLNTEKNIIDNSKNSYTSYKNSLERIDFLKSYVQKNRDILSIYLEQFEGGTRSFIDILNHENEIFRSAEELIEEEYNVLLNYYDMQFSFSYLTDSIIENKQNVCNEFKIKYQPRKLFLKEDTPLNDDLLENSLVIENEVSLTQRVKLEVERKIDNSEEVKSMLANVMNDIYSTKDIAVNKDENNVVLPSLKKKKEIKLEIKKKKLPKIDALEFNKAKIKKTFDNLDSNNYTIAIASIKGSEKDIEMFIRKYAIKKDVFTFKVGENREFTRILYGSYKTEEEAINAISTLHPNLISNKPYVSLIKNQQDAYIIYKN